MKSAPVARILFLGSSVAILLAGAPSAIADDGILIGVDSTGRLKAHIHEPEFEVEFSAFPQYPGWATGLLGIESTVLDEPDEDFYVPSSSSDVEIVMVSKDDGCEVWEGGTARQPGESFHVGNPFFDFHPIWQITEGPSGVVFTFRFYAHDREGIHADSEEFDINLYGAFCVADYDQNTFVTGDDFDSFVADFELGLPSADIDGNTFVNGDDFDYFSERFIAGC